VFGRGLRFSEGSDRILKLTVAWLVLPWLLALTLEGVTSPIPARVRLWPV
jgi:hypothetical protein